MILWHRICTNLQAMLAIVVCKNPVFQGGVWIVCTHPHINGRPTAKTDGLL